MWDTATASLEKAIEAEDLAFEMDPGGGAFYGPKIDLKIKDALGREWQMTTIQFDFNLPERFDMTYVDQQGKERRPFMVHRALLGSLERFFGVLIEHFGGAFPAWLAPLQIVTIPVAPAFFEYAQSIAERLREKGLRAKADVSENRMNSKIRGAQQKKVPYMLVLGEKEASGGSVSVRFRDGKQENLLDFDEFVGMVEEEVRAKR
jgi:threonyl-tRNA synthetase